MIRRVGDVRRRGKATGGELTLIEAVGRLNEFETSRRPWRWGRRWRQAEGEAGVSAPSSRGRARRAAVRAAVDRADRGRAGPRARCVSRGGGGFGRRRSLSRSDPSRDVACEGEDRAHRLVARIGGRSEPARAAAVDHRDAALAAIGGRRLGGAPAAGSAVHPDVLDPEVGALGIVSSARSGRVPMTTPSTPPAPGVRDD